MADDMQNMQANCSGACGAPDSPERGELAGVPQAPEGAIWNPENARGDLRVGIDVGSTTVKLAVLNDESQIVYAKYQRHHTDVRACARDLFAGAATVLPLSLIHI